MSLVRRSVILFLLWISIFRAEIFGETAFASPNNNCETPSYKRLANFAEEIKALDPRTECREIQGDVCQLISDEEKTSQSDSSSACELTYIEAKNALEEYIKSFKAQCARVGRLHKSCENADASQAPMAECLKKARESLSGPEAALGEVFLRAQEAMKKLDKKIKEARKAYKQDQTNIRNNQQAKCGKDKSEYQNDRYPGAIDAGSSAHAIQRGVFFQELSKAEDIVRRFQEITTQAIKGHQVNAQAFQTSAKQMGGIEDRLKSAQDSTTKNSGGESDITGTNKPASGMGAGQGGGSGGEASRGAADSQVPSSEGKDSSGSSSYLSQRGQVGSGNGGSRSSGAGSERNKLGEKSSESNESKTRSFSEGGGLGRPSSPSKSMSSGASKKPLSSTGAGKASALRGSGAPAGGGEVDKQCTTKTCEALAAANFGGAGSLGASPVSGLDGAEGGLADLESFLKTDGKQSPDASSSSLTPLDSQTAIGDSAIGPENGGNEAPGIEGVNGIDLFNRVRQFYEQAQRRGMLVGVTKKL